MKRLRLLVLLLLAAPQALAEQPTLSGRWSASAMQSSWNIGDWGTACGPRPGGGGAPAGTVTIAQQGSELTISGAGPTYSTTNCWEQFPGLVRSSHSGGARGWRTVCKTGASDPRQATVITTLSASDGYITFDETGQYQFVLQGQNCTASVRRSRSFRLIQREGEAPAAPAAPPPTTAAPTTAPPEPAAPQPAPRPTPPPAAAPDRCDDVGPPARLEVRPSRKLMRPGEQFAFRAAVLDAAGCPVLSATPAWKLVDPNAPVELVGPGKVRVRDGAPETEVALSVTMAEQTVKVTVEIASQARYEGLLRQRGLNEAGESAEAAVAVIASGSVGARSTVAQDRARGRRVIFAGVVGTLAALLGVAGVLVMRSSRRRAAELRERERAAAERAASAPMPVSLPRPVGMLCPTCRREYPPGATFCDADGNRLVPLAEEPPVRGPTGGICPVCGQGFDPGIRLCPQHGEELIPAALYLARQQAQPRPTKKICPLCGSQYEGEAQFCGTDGATLVPIN